MQLHTTTTMQNNTRRPKISTGTGDDGETGLFYGGRVPKTDSQIGATGDCDELNAAIGEAKCRCSNPARKEILETIQKDLFILMGDISLNRYTKEAKEELQLQGSRVRWVEILGADIEAKLPPAGGWDLPGANPESAALHTARTICRRAERHILAVPTTHQASKNARTYINRLSDLLYLLGREAATENQR